MPGSQQVQQPAGESSAWPSSSASSSVGAVVPQQVGHAVVPIVVSVAVGDPIDVVDDVDAVEHAADRSSSVESSGFMVIASGVRLRRRHASA